MCEDGAEIVLVGCRFKNNCRSLGCARDDNLRQCPKRRSGAGALFDGDGDLFDDFEAEAFERGNVHGGVGEQANALDAEVGEDLAAEADGAKDAAGAGLRALAGAELLVEEDAAGGCGRDGSEAAVPPGVERRGGGGDLVDLESARGVVEVEDRAAAFFGDHAHGVVEDLAAVAVGGEDVAGGAAGVHADENGVGAGRAGGAGSPGTLAGPS